MENSRQISLTCIVCKIAEAVVLTRVVDYWSDLNLFYPDQFAQLRGKPTLAQLLTCYNDQAKARNRSQQTDIIFLDLSKAFDSVPHERLLLKLQRHGIDGSLLLWIRNFLTNRRKGVVLRGNCSDQSPVISGVSQGTILGSILLVIYINDISTNITSIVKIYADDTKIYRTINEPDKDIPALQLDLNR